MYEKLYNSFAQQQKYSFSNRVPYGYSTFGNLSPPMTKAAPCEFLSNYRRRLSTEWSPSTISRADPPLLIQPSEIYHRHVGQLPNYAGHIPGSIFRSYLLYPYMLSSIREDFRKRHQRRKAMAKRGLFNINLPAK